MRPFQSSSISSKVDVRPSPIQGHGMFAKEPIKAGETVVVWGGDYVSREQAEILKSQGKLITQLDDDLFVSEERGDELTYFINHSCDPNVWMKDAFTLVARRPIQEGEELTVDYALFTADESYVAKWVCACHTKHCRKRITGKDWQIKDLQMRYKDHFTPMINRRIEKHLSDQ